jgi:DNA invertase Pin-like site-specific DNA recombinase
VLDVVGTWNGAAVTLQYVGSDGSSWSSVFKGTQRMINTMQELTALGVGFVSLSDSLDLTAPAGRALAGILGVFANFERDLIVKRVRGGMEHAKRHGTRSGKPIGRPATVAKREIEIRALTNAGRT